MTIFKYAEKLDALHSECPYTYPLASIINILLYVL